MASLGTPSKRGRGGTGGGTSHPTTPPCDPLWLRAHRGRQVAMLAEAGELSPPPKKTKLQHGRERPLFATELDTEWQKVYDNLVLKIKTAGAAIEALQQILKIERKELVAQGEKEEKKVYGLREHVKELEEKVAEKEKIWVHLKEEMVSRSREIAAMREAVSKLKKKKEADKNKKVPKVDKVLQTEVVMGPVAPTQTPLRTYVSVASQVEEVSEGEGEPTDKMDIDPPGLPKSGKKPQSSQGGTPTPKPMQATPTSGRLVRAFVVHGVACHGPWQARIQEVERAVGRKGGESLVCGGFSSSIGGGGRHSVPWLSFSRGQ